MPARRRIRSLRRPVLDCERLEGKVLLNGDLSNVGDRLAMLYQQREEGGFNLTDPAYSVFSLQDDAILVEIHGRGDFNALLEALQPHNFQATVTLAGAGLVDGYLPLDQLPTVAGLEQVVSVMPVWVGNQTDAQGSVTNQAETSLKADIASRLFGIDGTGLVIGVISDSFDSGTVLDGNGNPNRFADSVASGDLPPAPQTQILIDGPGTDEGRAMMELIYDIAPGANFRFASGGATEAGFANAVNALVAAGCNVIVDDLHGLFFDPYLQDGVTTQAIANAVNQGVAYFASAGNRGSSGYESPFQGANGTVAGITGRWHDFDAGPGVGLTQDIIIQPGTTNLVFQFDDPWRAATRHVEFYVLNAAGNPIGTGGTTNTAATGLPQQIVTVNNPGTTAQRVSVAVRQVSGPDIGRFKYIGFNAPTIILPANVAPGAMIAAANPTHSAAVESITVAASAWFTNPPAPESFTGVGPVTRVFDAAGNRLPTLEVRNKPDITSHDGVDTTVPGFNPFFGTSAAAPNAAAVAALLREFNPALTPAGVRAAMIAGTVDIPPAGWDNVTGFGLIDAVGVLLSQTNGVLTINGDFDSPNQDDAITIAVDPTDSTQITVTINGVLLGSIRSQFINRIDVNGLGGDDTLTIDLSNGDPTPSGGIHFDGGTQGTTGDALTISGGGFESVTYLPDGATFGTGRFTFGASFVGFIRTEEVFTLNLNDVTLVTPNDRDVMTIAPRLGARNRITGSSGGVAFSDLTFGGVTNVLIDSRSNNPGGLLGNEYTIDNPGGPALQASGLQRFTIRSSAGDDTLTVNAADFRLPVAGGEFLFDAGTGLYPPIDLPASNLRGLISFDQIIVNADVDFLIAEVGPLASDRTRGEGLLSIASPGSGLAGSAALGSIRLVGVEGATLSGGASDNRMDGSGFSGTLTLNGGDGDDVLIGGSGDNELNAGGGDDLMIVGPDSLAVAGLGSQNQTVYRGGGTNILRGGTGRNTFRVDLNGTAELRGGDGENLYVVTNPAGGLVNPVGGITIQGAGKPTDVLRLEGGGGKGYNQIHLLGPTPGAGNIVTTNNRVPDGPTTSQFIRYDGVVRIEDSVAVDEMVVVGESAAAPIGGVTSADLAAGVLNPTVGGLPFGEIAFANKSAPMVQLADGQLVTLPPPPAPLVIAPKPHPAPPAPVAVAAPLVALASTVVAPAPVVTALAPIVVESPAALAPIAEGLARPRLVRPLARRFPADRWVAARPSPAHRVAPRSAPMPARRVAFAPAPTRLPVRFPVPRPTPMAFRGPLAPRGPRA